MSGQIKISQNPDRDNENFKRQERIKENKDKRKKERARDGRERKWDGEGKKRRKDINFDSTERGEMGSQEGKHK